MTRDEIEAANPQQGGWALVKTTNMYGWVRVFSVVCNHDGSKRLGIPSGPDHTEWFLSNEILLIAPPSDEPPPLPPRGHVDLSDTDRDAAAWMRTDDTIVGHAARIVEIAEAGLPADAALQLLRLVDDCRLVCGDYEAAGRFREAAETSGRPVAMADEVPRG